MISFIIKSSKLILMAVAAILVSQIIGQVPVGNRRLCDYAEEAVQSRYVQGPIEWISEKFDFIEGHGVSRRRLAKAKKRNGHVVDERSQNNVTDPEHSESENRATLSGFLKR